MQYMGCALMMRVHGRGVQVKTDSFQHPHSRYLWELGGLCKDGVQFTLARIRGMPQPIARAGESRAALLGGSDAGAGADGLEAGGAGAAAATATAGLASRGSASRLHMAASVGDATALEKQLNKVLKGQTPQAAAQLLNGGDKRRYTAFHVACAGGHAQCASLLLEAGCDGLLLNEAGKSGWGLALELKRTEILALPQYDAEAVEAAEAACIHEGGVAERATSRSSRSSHSGSGSGGSRSHKGSRSGKEGKSSRSKSSRSQNRSGRAAKQKSSKERERKQASEMGGDGGAHGQPERIVM
eukprot:COSAG01_NODE_7800_length_3052_cov_2.179478_2_plen_299_part_00